MKSFEIFFSDLNDDAKQRLLEAVGVSSAKEMNWDINILPIASYDYEETEKGE